MFTKLLLKLLGNKDARYLLVILVLLCAAYFYRSESRIAQIALATRPKVEEKKSVREERGEVRKTRKFVDGKVVEEVTVSAPMTKTVDTDKKSEPVLNKIRVDRILVGAAVTSKTKLPVVGYSFNNRLDLLAGTDFKGFYLGQLVLRF